jgi:phosphosulfolactate phosphohydrolase-like enzyme
VKRQDAPRKGRFSLSPATFLSSEHGAHVVLDSPNGAACCVLVRASPCVVAGAISSHLDLDKSPEAQACEAAFRSVRDSLEETLLHCGSGLELCENGYAVDVLHAARLDLYRTVPLLVEGRFVNANPGLTLVPTGERNQ